MKKEYYEKRILLLIMALCLLTLAGCGGCEHEWTEADCLTAKTCSLCQVTEGEPLGHDWQAADCEDPETCTRCGLIQGAALGHSYGKWSMTEEKMVRACENCGGEEAVEPDYDVYLQQQMQGHWDTQYVSVEGQIITGYSVGGDILMYYADVKEDGLTFFDMQETIQLTWAYESHSVIEGVTQYILMCSANGEPALSVSFLENQAGGCYMLIPMGGENYIMLSRNEQWVEILEGTWVASDKGEGYSVTFRKDGTFDGSLPEGERSGTWHLKTVGTTYGTSIHANFNLCYEQEGEAKGYSGSIYFGDSASDRSTYQENASFNITGMNLSFSWIAEDQIETWKTALAEGPGKLVGEYTGTEERIYDYNSGKSTASIPEGYTADFREDGTFTAVLGDEEITGIWYFVDVNVGSGYVSYTYRWKRSETDSEQNYISLSSGQLSMSLPSDRKRSRTVNFMALTEENLAAMAEAADKPLGLWTSTHISVWNNDTNISTGRATTDYSVEFFADGTFTAKLDQQISGSWRFRECLDYGNGLSFHYNCEIGPEDNRNMYFYVQEDGTLHLHYTVDRDSYSYSFEKLDEAGRAARKAQIEAAAALPVGTWESATYTVWDNNTGEGKDEPHSGYALEIREDGTMTVRMEQTFESTWTLSNIYRGEGYVSYSYDFTHDMPENWSFHCDGEGGLSLSYYDQSNGISHNYSFEKQ